MKVKSIRKMKRKKRYNANVNRKRLRNKLQKLPEIPCTEIKEAWQCTKSTRVNLKEMGLAYDANEAVKQIPRNKSKILRGNKAKELRNKILDLDVPTTKSDVVNMLEADAKAPRVRSLKIPNGQAQFLTYLIKTYGEDYEAMSMDKKNYDQLTWKQIRAKIKLFKGIPEQYNKWLENDDV